MPGGDGTGPMGMGAMTGRRMGYCAGYSVPGFANAWPAGFGRGAGIGFGRGRGNRFWARTTGLPGWYRAGAGYPAFGGWPVQAPSVPVQQNPPVQAPAGFQPQVTKEQEAQMLEQEKGFLESQINSIKSELEEIGKRLSQIKKGK
jgi:hypothetical protein